MDKNFRIMFLRDDRFQPVGCIAINLTKGGQVSYQVSVLNPVDNFDRKVARQLAIGRLIEKPIFANIESRSMFDISTVVMQSIVSSKHFPARAVKAARNWLKYNSEA